MKPEDLLEFVTIWIPAMFHVRTVLSVTLWRAVGDIVPCIRVKIHLATALLAASV